MSTIKMIRSFFGISQEDLAAYLSVSRTLLSMCEIEERELPSAASMKLLKMVSIMNAMGGFNEPPSITPIPAAPQGNNKKLEREAEDCEWMVRKLHRQLATMQQRYAQAVHSLELVQQLSASLTKEEEGKDDQLWVDIIEAEAKKDAKTFGTEEQALLQWKIEWYQFGGETARALLK